MLRALIVLLLVVNLAFWCWTRGWLDGLVGVRSIGDREPERMQKQVRPETIRVLTPQAVLAAASAAEAKMSCIEAGPFSVEELASAQTALAAAAPSVAFTSVRVERPGAWLVYMGRYSNPEAMQKKREELLRTKLPFEELDAPPDLAPGFSLGRFEASAAASAALARLTQRGIRTAKVVQQAQPSAAYKLRLERTDAETAAKLFALRSEALHNGFGACAS
jgi:hypothetical protein